MCVYVITRVFFSVFKRVSYICHCNQESEDVLVTETRSKRCVVRLLLLLKVAIGEGAQLIRTMGVLGVRGGLTKYLQAPQTGVHVLTVGLHITWGGG